MGYHKRVLTGLWETPALVLGRVPDDFLRFQPHLSADRLPSRLRQTIKADLLLRSSSQSKDIGSGRQPAVVVEQPSVLVSHVQLRQLVPAARMLPGGDGKVYLGLVVGLVLPRCQYARDLDGYVGTFLEVMAVVGRNRALLRLLCRGISSRCGCEDRNRQEALWRPQCSQSLVRFQPSCVCTAPERTQSSSAACSTWLPTSPWSSQTFSFRSSARRASVA